MKIIKSENYTIKCRRKSICIFKQMISFYV